MVKKTKQEKGLDRCLEPFLHWVPMCVTIISYITGER